ncbi:MAG TPA: pitrilysin family protein [Nitrosospira sp.]|nr:pitrilysin family protein [Nitrosospira sp.]
MIYSCFRFFPACLWTALIIPILLFSPGALASTHEFTLGNGLRLIVKEDHRSPVVISQIWYKAGSIDEVNGRTGVAHVLEHMMFKGTKKVPGGEFSRLIAAAGGRENAFTGQDYTGYFQQLHKSRLPLAMELESDRMRNLVLAEEEFSKEIKVVMEERRVRTDESENDRLSDFNRMETFRRLERNEEALSFTYRLLDSHKGDPALQSYLFSVRDDLIVKSSKQVTGGVDFKTLGRINFIESRARFNMPSSRGVLAAEVKHTYLDSSNPAIVLPAHNEVDIMAEFKHPLWQGAYQVNVGGNLREVDSIAYGAARVNQDVTSRLKTSLRIGVNELSHETGALRALGKKDTLLLGVTTQLTPQTFLHVDIDGHRYSTREGNNLGKGYKVQTILGHSLLRGIQDWQVRLQGSFENNDLAKTTPPDLIGVISPSLPGVEVLIPRKFALAGVGSSFRYGPFDQGVLRRPFVLGDAWTGWVWPANDLGYNARLSAGISLLGPDILSASVFYSNVQAGRTSQAYAGAGLQYSIRF